MKFLIYSNAPTVQTGYGVMCAMLAERLTADGHEVAVACNYGHQVGLSRWDSPAGPVALYPSSENPGYSIEVLIPHALHFFGGDPLGGWIITLIDQWVLNPLDDGLKEFNVLAWTPVDHWPLPPEVARFIARSGAHPVAMSQFGQAELTAVGIDAEYAPHGIDTTVYRPTPVVETASGPVVVRQSFGIDLDAFVVLMVAMNKDPQDRKSFNEAFRGFALFHQEHPNSVLVVHSDRSGAMGSGINLEKLARHAGIPQSAVIYTDPYARLMGITPSRMAALYTAADVLLAPSKGEGFGIPVIEAQSCGTPVIVSDFSAQSELVGPGWKVGGQMVYDPQQDSNYWMPYVAEIAAALTECHDADRDAIAAECRKFASQYDVSNVWAEHWKPIIASLAPTERSGLPKIKHVDILVPIVRDANRERLMNAIAATSPAGKVTVLEGEIGRTYSENVNALLAQSTADWVLVIGDDTEPTPGWFSAARALSDRYDVIGTNDAEPGRVRNPDVAAGRHADHFLIRRSYIDDVGACLDGPGILAPEAYRHWWTDREIIGLARARGVYGHAFDCRIIHHHPGFDGDQAAREADPLYKAAAESNDADARTFGERLGLILEQKTFKGRL